MGIKGMMNVPFVIRLFSKSAGPQTFYVVEGFTAGTLLAALDKVGDTPVGLGAGGLVDLASILGRGRGPRRSRRRQTRWQALQPMPRSGA